MGWFPCAAAVLGSPNAQGKPAQHIHLPMQEPLETQVLFLGWENTLEEEMATCSRISDWNIPRTEEPDRLQS